MSRLRQRRRLLALRRYQLRNELLAGELRAGEYLLRFLHPLSPALNRRAAGVPFRCQWWPR